MPKSHGARRRSVRSTGGGPERSETVTPDRVPDILPLDELYLDVDAFFDDLAEYAGSRSLLRMAEAVGVNRGTLRRLRRKQNASLTLETYARICAIMRRPYGSWLKICHKDDISA